jgi:hypothetical protein
MPTGAPFQAFEYARHLAWAEGDVSFFARPGGPERKRWIRVTRRPLSGARQGFAMNIVESVTDNESLCKELERHYDVGVAVLSNESRERELLVMFEGDSGCAVSHAFREAAGVPEAPSFLEMGRAKYVFNQLFDAIRIQGKLWQTMPSDLALRWRDDVCVRLSGSGTWWRLVQSESYGSLTKELSLVVTSAKKLDRAVARSYDKEVVLRGVEMDRKRLIAITLTDSVVAVSESAARLLAFQKPTPEDALASLAKGQREEYRQGRIAEALRRGTSMKLEVTGRMIVVQPAEKGRAEIAGRVAICLGTVELANAVSSSSEEAEA